MWPYNAGGGGKSSGQQQQTSCSGSPPSSAAAGPSGDSCFPSNEMNYYHHQIYCYPDPSQCHIDGTAPSSYHQDMMVMATQQPIT